MPYYKKRKYEDETNFKDKGKPKGDEKLNPGLSIKALKDLPRSSVTMKTDPYENSLPGSTPYAILNGFNSKVGGKYAGEANLDGGNVQQYANSERSAFLKFFDFMRLKVNMNYRYLPDYDTPVGKGLIDETIKSLAEAYSLLGATTYTSLAFNNFVVETDMNMGTSEPVDGKYVNQAEVFYAISRWYQEFWLDIANSFTWHNSFRLKQGAMIRSAWNREVPLLNALFGLFNKKAWLNLLEGISMSFEGEYIDTQFIQQASMLNATPSRRSDSITDPMLEIQTKYMHPTIFKVYYRSVSNGVVTDTLIFNQDELTFNVGNGETVNIFEVIDRFNDRLAAENIMYWARNTQLTDQTGEAWFNPTKQLLGHIVQSMAIVKKKFSDFREAMDVLSRTGTVSWAKGYRPTIVQDTTADTFDVLLINDIYQLVMSGAFEVKFNNVTKRWRSFSLWNMYTGIPEYDAYQGGAFLSLSCKEIDYDTDDDNNIAYVPIALVPAYSDDSIDNTGGVVYCVARDGVPAVIRTEPVVMSTDLVLARLVPLDSQFTESVKVPYADPNDENYSRLTTQHKSALYRGLLQVFGLARVNTSSGVEDFGVDPDIIAIYQYEVNDFTNMSINYVRNNAPIRSTYRDTSFLGFYGTLKA